MERKTVHRRTCGPTWKNGVFIHNKYKSKPFESRYHKSFGNITHDREFVLEYEEIGDMRTEQTGTPRHP